MSCYLQIFIKILLWQFLSHLHCKDCHWKCIICSCRQHVLILMDKNILMLILILPTRLKFCLLSTSVYWNLTTFWVEKKNGKIPQDAVQALDIVLPQMPSIHYTPVGRSFFTFDGQGRLLGERCEGKFGFYSSIQHSEWKAVLVNIDGE